MSKFKLDKSFLEDVVILFRNYPVDNTNKNIISKVEMNALRTVIKAVPSKKGEVIVDIPFGTDFVDRYQDATSRMKEEDRVLKIEQLRQMFNNMTSFRVIDDVVSLLDNKSIAKNLSSLEFVFGVAFKFYGNNIVEYASTSDYLKMELRIRKIAKIFNTNVNLSSEQFSTVCKYFVSYKLADKDSSISEVERLNKLLVVKDAKIVSLERRLAEYKNVCKCGIDSRPSVVVDTLSPM